MFGALSRADNGDDEVADPAELPDCTPELYCGCGALDAAATVPEETDSFRLTN